MARAKLPTSLPTNASLKPLLDDLYDSFNVEESSTDPVNTLRRYADPADREVVAFMASALAFGRVGSVLASVDRVLVAMGDSPARFVRAFKPSRDATVMQPLVHRWTRGPDLVALVLVLQRMLDEHGSIEGFFAAGHDGGATDIEAGLESFTSRASTVDVRAAYGVVPRRPGVLYFFPRPSGGSGCKRLNLFLRWMVRRDAVDPGGWTAVRPSQLVVPLDTHVIRLGRCLRLTRYASPGWRMATEITAALRALDPEDPVRYDFALCHLGMMRGCGFGQPQGSRSCPLRPHCHPRAARRTARPTLRTRTAR